jgi:DNA-binding XRE family transcriptional regulator
MITSEQVRAARAMLRLEQEELAKKANLSLKTIKRLEANSGQVNNSTAFAVKRALEYCGIEFIDKDDFKGRSEGVRLLTDRTAPLRRKIVESVGHRLGITLEIAVQKDEDLFERDTNEVVELVLKEMSENLAESLRSLLRKE